MAEDNLTAYEAFLDGVPYIYGALLLKKAETLLFGKSSHSNEASIYLPVRMPGVQLVLFCICVYLLATKRSPAHLIVMLSIIAMFVLAIADTGISFHYAVHDIPGVIKSKTDIGPTTMKTLLKGYLYVTNK
ncbi:hypothetical protein H0H87_001886 [Tephrocybe sp. NHM501043]|nr:hypothetical protein H0H87_001886 [Tephrocybe sp. NHM501043]